MDVSNVAYGPGKVHPYNDGSRTKWYVFKSLVTALVVRNLGTTDGFSIACVDIAPYLENNHKLGTRTKWHAKRMVYLLVTLEKL